MQKNKSQLDSQQLAERFTEPSFRADLPSDAELLELYVVGGCRDSLLTLVKRYSPLVASVVRRMVSNLQDAEDAFQATFLVFLQSAHKIQKQGSVAAWLYGVAYRVSSRVRQTSCRKRGTTINENELPVATHENPLANLARQIEMETLDQELQKLPESLRGPLIEHYIMGHSASDIADRLDASVSAIEGRLRRGRKLLRYRLAMRGTSLSIVLAGAAWFRIQSAMAAECVAWTSNFVDSTASYFEGADSITSSNLQTSSLVKGELAMKTMISTKTLGVLSAATLSVLAIAAGAMAYQFGGGGATNRAGVVSLNAASSIAASEEATQFGGGSYGGGSSGGAVTEAGGGSPSAGGGFGMGSGLAGLSPTDVKQLTKPEGRPGWLESGKSDREKIEENRQRLHDSLVPVDFQNQTLSQVLNSFQENAKIPIKLKTSALAEEGISIDEPISISLPEMPLCDALDVVLNELNLTYEVHESYINVTTKDAAIKGVRFYDLAFVLPTNEAMSEVVNTIEQVVEEEEWASNGGDATLSSIGSMLVVRCSEHAHREIEKLLSELEKMQPDNFFPASTYLAPQNNPVGQGGGMGGGGMTGGGGFF